MMENAIEYVALAIGIAAGLIIVYGVIRGLADLVRVEIRSLRSRRDTSITFEGIRYDIGFHLLLGLEFLIAADIIRTIVRPTLDELGILAGIVAIRTVISYFLNKEISVHKDRQPPGGEHAEDRHTY
jgi:uncharacterized membrane protein